MFINSAHSLWDDYANMEKVVLTPNRAWISEFRIGQSAYWKCNDSSNTIGGFPDYFTRGIEQLRAGRYILSRQTIPLPPQLHTQLMFECNYIIYLERMKATSNPWGLIYWCD